MRKLNFFSEFFKDKHKDKKYVNISIIVLCIIAFELVIALPIYNSLSKHIGVILILPCVLFIFFAVFFYMASIINFYFKTYKNK